MGCVLTVYSKSAYKKYLLPAVRDANYSIILFKDLFRISGDVKVELENTSGAWRILPGAYSLAYTDTRKNAVGQTLRDSDVFSLTLRGGDQVTVVVTISESFFHAFEKFRLDARQTVSIGTGDANDISYDFMHAISKVHALIRREAGRCMLEDKSVNGVFVNAERVNGSRELEYGDLVDLYGLSLVYLGDVLAVDVTTSSVSTRNLKPFSAPEAETLPEPEEGTYIIRRSPRYLPKMADDTVSIEPPPELKEKDRQPAILAIGPSLTMALPMMLGMGLSIFASSQSGTSSIIMLASGMVMAVGSAILGAFWALMNMKNARKQLREDELKRFEVYGEYLISCTNKVQERYQRNTEILKQMYPDAQTCSKYDQNSSQLWTRNRNHPDFLEHRLGIGSRPFQVKIDVPEERFSMHSDSMSEKARMVAQTYSRLKDVPVCVDFRRKLIGVVGGPGKKGCYPVVHALTVQLAANNCYSDVKLGYVYSKSTRQTQENWRFTRWLPHVWSEDHRVRYVADSPDEASDVFFEVAKVLRMRAETDERTAAPFNPHYVLFIEDMSVLEGELITTFLMDDRDLGITVVLLAESYEDLPNKCEYIIEYSPSFRGMYEVTDFVEDRLSVDIDTISGVEVERFARRISRIQVNESESGGELPGSLTFFDMYGIHKLSELDVETRWRKNRTYDNIKGLLGQKAGGADCYLDVHEKYHGPHGLIAGTTGSGKSETLQTYMLSLAINYSPDDVGFFVIDYKGGGMANLFSDLPHLIGQISNLSGNQVHRAMVSIKSENVRRQRVFNEHGVNNINNYTRLYKNGEAAMPVPHLFIVIDEFAELKREEPEFMKELISVAQVGRSLGVHLILATQKPSGTVDDNIWSNSKFRLCLRVQDQQDSKDMLHRPDAAYITQAGRCYLQVGNDEIFELFQSGWSGADYDEDDTGARGDIAMILSITGKAAIVGSYSKVQKKEGDREQWIASLLELLDLAAGDASALEAAIGNVAEFRSVSEGFFALAAERGLDFAPTEYNQQRLRDLAGAACAALREDPTLPRRREEYARRTIACAAAARGKLPEIQKKTQLEAVVEYLGRVAQDNGYTNDLQLWLPVLPSALCLEDLEGYRENVFDGKTWPAQGRTWELEALVGMCDDPVNQAQMPLVVNFAENGSHLILGTVISGKSTFIQTLLYSLISRYTPRDLNIYALDFSSKMLSSLEGAAQVGGVLYENDGEKIGKLFTMLDNILEQRKLMFRGGGFREYVQAARAAGKDAPAAIILAVDNFAAFNTKTGEAYEAYIQKFAKEGVNCGIFLLISAMGISYQEMPSRLAENIRTCICLEMGDRYAYAEALHMTRIEVLPEANVKGRGLAKVGDDILEFQTALAVEAEDDFSRASRIRENLEAMDRCWDGPVARHIPEVPEKPEWTEFSRLEDVAAMWEKGEALPIGYNDANAAVYGINLKRSYCYLVSGKARTGKSNAMRVAARSAAAMGAELVFIDFGNEFSGFSEAEGARTIGSDKEMFDWCAGTLTQEFSERNAFKWECLDAGDSDEELYAKMQKYPKKFIFIGNLTEFVLHASNPGDGVEPTASFLANLFDKGAGHNIWWFAAMNQDDVSKVSGQELFELFTAAGRGIHFGGNVAAQRALDFEYIRFNERAKTMKPGVGMLPQQDDEDALRVVVPNCRK